MKISISVFVWDKVYITMDLLVDLSSLSEDIREKLAELDLELSEGKLFLSNIKMGKISSHSHYLNICHLNIACGLCFEYL